jgi:hypothetical protein
MSTPFRQCTPQRDRLDMIVNNLNSRFLTFTGVETSTDRDPSGRVHLRLKFNWLINARGEANLRRAFINSMTSNPSPPLDNNGLLNYSRRTTGFAAILSSRLG